MDSFSWVFVISIFPINLFLLLPLDFPGSGLLCGTCQVVSLCVRIQDSALALLSPHVHPSQRAVHNCRERPHKAPRSLGLSSAPVLLPNTVTSSLGILIHSQDLYRYLQARDSQTHMASPASASHFSTAC